MSDPRSARLSLSQKHPAVARAARRPLDAPARPARRLENKGKKRSATRNVISGFTPSCIVRRGALGLIVAVALTLQTVGRALETELPVSFIRDVAPVLAARCVGCHGADQAESDYRLDTFEALMTAGATGSAPVAPGDVADSLLATLVASADPDVRMPKEGDPLSDRQQTAIRQWIAAGAQFDGADRSSLLSAQLARPQVPDPPTVYAAPLPATALAFHPDGARLVAGGCYELIEWETTRPQIARRIPGNAQRTYALEFDPSGSLLAVAGGAPGVHGEARLLNGADYAEIKVLGTSDDVALDCAFRPDGKELAVGFADRSIRVYDATSGAELRTIQSHADFVTDVAWSDDGRRLGAASCDGSAKLFDARSGELIAAYMGHGQPVYGIAFSPDGEHAFSSGVDKKVHKWTTAKGERVAIVSEFSAETYKLATRRGQLFSASADGVVRQHDAQSHQLAKEFARQTEAVLSLAVDAAGERMATGCFDGQIRIWNLASGELLQTFVLAPGWSAPDPK